MERLLKPRIFDTEHTAPDATKQWKHFHRTFQNFLTAVQGNENRLQLLQNHVSPEVYTLIEECESYEQAITLLKRLYVKTPNAVYARHLLMTRRQQNGETLDSYLQCLKDLSKDCDFRAVTAVQHRDEYIRDSFISGIQSQPMRTRLLENVQLDLDTMATQARALDTAQKSSVSFQAQQFQVSAVRNESRFSKSHHDTPPDHTSAKNNYGVKVSSDRCQFCGYDSHPRYKCPASNETCGKCGKRGHFRKVCRFTGAINQQSGASAAITGHDHASEEESNHSGSDDHNLPWLSTILAGTKLNSIISVTLGKSKQKYSTLVDSGSDLTFIHPRVVSNRSFKVFPPTTNEIVMANTELKSKVMGTCRESLQFDAKEYNNVELLVLPGLCADIILGKDFQSLHESVTIKYGGDRPPLVIGAADASVSSSPNMSDPPSTHSAPPSPNTSAPPSTHSAPPSQSNSTPPAHICSLLGALGTLNIEPPALFPNMCPDIKPIATSRRRYNSADTKFIDQEVQRLLAERIIEKSNSPWRAQPIVVTRGNKKRLAIDYSETINKFTNLDAYPLPRIDETVNSIAQYGVYTTMDLKWAYNQYEISEEDRPYTAFEANGGLYQYRRLPFGVTNGVACFQRAMDKFISDNELDATYAYLDNITICGKNQAHHDENLQKFMKAAKKANLTFNEDKCEFSTRSLKILGSVVENGTIRPDPDRLQPLLNLSAPQNVKQLKRTLGFFAHYSTYIRHFSSKVRPLSQTTSFPLSEEALNAFNQLKSDVKDSVMGAVDVSVPFTLETDASDYAIGAVLNQCGRPVAFFSRTLQPSEVKHSAVEKEALAIIESVRHWRHFLTGSHFTLQTDQKSVAYMFDKNHKGKVKNDKIHRWRMELSCYSFDIQHKPGVQNIPADTLSRNICSGTVQHDKLYHLHDSLHHPGITRLYHFIKTRNLPYSLDEVREMDNACRICARNKPRFPKSENSHIIKATQPFERLSVDFKGPLPSTNQNKYLLDIVDEYSRFPFAFPCKDMTASTVNKCFAQLFSMFGVPSYIHTDQGSNFMSKEVKDFLLKRNVATSRTTPYNPEGNGQVEKLNGTLWKSVTLALQSRGLDQCHWQDVLPDSLHSVRSLLCTSTNVTPHERMFLFQRRSSTGSSVPTWLTEADTALLKRHVRRSKQEPLCDEVDVLQVNPHYVHIRTGDGTEKTVSVKHLAPPGSTPPTAQVGLQLDNIQGDTVFVEPEVQPQVKTESPVETIPPPQPVIRRVSERSTKGQPPERLQY